MSVMFVIIVVGVLAWAVFTQVQARQQVNVESQLNKAAASQVVRKYFGPTWTLVSGPGQFNFRPKLRRMPPTISVNLVDSATGCEANIWMSGATVKLGVVNHATLMWRKKRGLAARLLSETS